MLQCAHTTVLPEERHLLLDQPRSSPPPRKKVSPELIASGLIPNRDCKTSQSNGTEKIWLKISLMIAVRVSSSGQLFAATDMNICVSDMRGGKVTSVEDLSSRWRR